MVGKTSEIISSNHSLTLAWPLPTQRHSTEAGRSSVRGEALGAQGQDHSCTPSKAEEGISLQPSEWKCCREERAGGTVLPAGVQRWPGDTQRPPGLGSLFTSGQAHHRLSFVATRRPTSAPASPRSQLGARLTAGCPQKLCVLWARLAQACGSHTAAAAPRAPRSFQAHQREPKRLPPGFCSEDSRPFRWFAAASRLCCCGR